MAHQFAEGEKVLVRGYGKKSDGSGVILKVGDNTFECVRLDGYDYSDDDEEDDPAYHYIPKKFVFPFYEELAYDPTQQGDRDDDI